MSISIEIVSGLLTQVYKQLPAEMLAFAFLI